MLDRSPFEHYVAEHGRRLLRSARLLTGDWHSAEDLTQEALTRLYVAWPRLREAGAADAYARRTLGRLYVRGQSRRWTREIPSESVPDRSEMPPSEDDKLVAELALLPPRQRATLILRFFDDMSVQQVAFVLRCSPGTVKSQTSKGLDRLRVAMTEEPTEETTCP